MGVEARYECGGPISPRLGCRTVFLMLAMQVTLLVLVLLVTLCLGCAARRSLRTRCM